MVIIKIIINKKKGVLNTETPEDITKEEPACFVVYIISDSPSHLSHL